MTVGPVTVRQEFVAAIRSVLSNRPQWSKCLLARTGIDDGQPRKLQDIADNAPQYGFERAVTRERVRQVLEKARCALRSATRTPQWSNFHQATADILPSLPCSVEKFMAHIGYQDCRDPRRLCMELEGIAELFGLDFSFRLAYIGTVGPLVIHERDEAGILPLHKLDRLAGSIYGEVSETAMSIGCSTEVLTRAIQVSERWEFLDRSGRYFWKRPALPPPRYEVTGNKVLTVLCILFAAADRAYSCDLARSIIRHRSLRNRHIPSRVIELIAQKSGLFVVVDGEIRRGDTWSWFHVSDRDRILLDIVARHGPVVFSDILYSELIRGGLSKENASITVACSPFLTHTQSGVGFKRGIYKCVMALDGGAEPSRRDRDSAGGLRIHMTARALLTGRLYCDESPNIDGTWRILHGPDLLKGEIRISGHVIAGLGPIIQTLGLRKGDTLELRTTERDGVLEVVA